jgi:hypothetical protein
MKRNQVLGGYQALYGAVATVQHLYLLFACDGCTTQTAVILGGMMLFSVLVLAAGVLQLTQRTGWWWAVCFVQAVQIGSLDLNGLYLRLRCGISYNLKMEGGVVAWSIELLDTTSEWRGGPCLPKPRGLT